MRVIFNIEKINKDEAVWDYQQFKTIVEFTSEVLNDTLNMIRP